MRKALLFVIAVAMVIGGLLLLGGELLVATIISFKFVIGGTLLASLGVYLLWADFVASLLGIKGEP
jgi:hypothetical protein